MQANFSEAIYGYGYVTTKPYNAIKLFKVKAYYLAKQILATKMYNNNISLVRVRYIDTMKVYERIFHLNGLIYSLDDNKWSD